MTSTGSTLSERFIRQLDDSDLRHEYMADQMRLRVALLIRTLREQRGWSQEELAERMGTSQSAVSRIENPDYGKLAVQTLLEAAQAFDLPLLIDMPEWTDWLGRMREHASASLQRHSFDADRIIEEQKAATARCWVSLPTRSCSRAAFVWASTDRPSVSVQNFSVMDFEESASERNPKVTFNTVGSC